MPSDELPEWERVLSAAARLQEIIPDAVLVGGTASAVHARYRPGLTPIDSLTGVSIDLSAVLT